MSIGLEVGKVTLSSYDNEWVKNFEEEKKNLEIILKDLIVTIEHVGSTSIGNIKAKPVVDIAIGVKSKEDFKLCAKRFEGLEDYSVKEDSVEDELLVRKGPVSKRTNFIHIMAIDSEKYKDTIIFRDYMRKNKEARKDYEKLKIELANKYSSDRKMYTKSKDEYIKAILKEAKEQSTYNI